MNRQEIPLRSGATLIIDHQMFRKVRRTELTKKIGYSRRHLVLEKSRDLKEREESLRRETDRLAELVLQRENLLGSEKL